MGPGMPLTHPRQNVSISAEPTPRPYPTSEFVRFYFLKRRDWLAGLGPSPRVETGPRAHERIGRTFEQSQVKGIATKNPSEKTGSMEGMVEMTQKTMILDQKIEKKEKEKKRKKKKEKRKKRKGKKIQDSPPPTSSCFLPIKSCVPDCCSSSTPVPSRKLAERRGGSRGQGWAYALTLVEGPPCSQGGGDPPHPTPIIWEKKKQREKENSWEGEKITKSQALTTAVKPNIGKGVGGREGQVCPRSPPWAPLPRGLEIRHQIPHRTLMLKNGNQISLAGGQPGQGAGGLREPGLGR